MFMVGLLLRQLSVVLAVPDLRIIPLTLFLFNYLYLFLDTHHVIILIIYRKVETREGVGTSMYGRYVVIHKSGAIPTLSIPKRLTIDCVFIHRRPNIPHNHGA
jgi:hypothetical protein